MISPVAFTEMYKDSNYKELLKIRDELIESIKGFEQNPDQDNGIMPSPQTIYQCNLEYLGELCKMIAEKFNEEYVWGE